MLTNINNTVLEVDEKQKEVIKNIVELYTLTVFQELNKFCNERGFMISIKELTLQKEK